MVPSALGGRLYSCNGLQQEARESKNSKDKSIVNVPLLVLVQLHSPVSNFYILLLIFCLKNFLLPSLPTVEVSDTTMVATCTKAGNKRNKRINFIG